MDRGRYLGCGSLRGRGVGGGRLVAMAGRKAGKFRFLGSALSLDGMGAGGTKIAAMPRGFSGFDSAAAARAAGRRGEWAFFGGIAACLSAGSLRLRGCEPTDVGAGADEF